MGSSGDARIVLEQLGSDELLLNVRRPGVALVRVRWSPCRGPAGAWSGPGTGPA
jgi:hypothetical protein